MSANVSSRGYNFQVNYFQVNYIISQDEIQGEFEQDGTICMMPVVVYSKKYLDELREEIDEVKIRIATDEQPLFDSVDAMFAKLEAD